jgi:DNA-directed RNA polymerase specialized sigma24 family protein
MRDEKQRAADRFLGLLRPIERDLELYCRRLIWNPPDVSDAIQNAVPEQLIAEIEQAIQQIIPDGERKIIISNIGVLLDWPAA